MTKVTRIFGTWEFGLIVFMGVYPKPVLERMEPSVSALVAHVESNVARFREPGPKSESQLFYEAAERERLAAESGSGEEKESDSHGGGK